VIAADGVFKLRDGGLVRPVTEAEKATAAVAADKTKPTAEKDQ
jgi:hypothetical protein